MIRKESHSVVSCHKNSSGKVHVNFWVDGKIVFYTEEIFLVEGWEFFKLRGGLLTRRKWSNIYLLVPVIEIELGNFLGLLNCLDLTF